MRPRGWRRLGRSGLVLVTTAYCVFPIYFMLVQSLKTAQEDVFGNPLIVTRPTLENFEELFERTLALRYREITEAQCSNPRGARP